MSCVLPKCGYPKQVVVLALAALTNVALAMHMDPALPEKLVSQRFVGFRPGPGCSMFKLALVLRSPSPSPHEKEAWEYMLPTTTTSCVCTAG